MAQVLGDLPDPPTDSAVRAALHLLEQKGLVRHSQPGRQNVYQPVTPVNQARRSALRHLVDTFFRGSREGAVAAMLEEASLSDEEFARVLELIRERRKGKEQK